MAEALPSIDSINLEVVEDAPIASTSGSKKAKPKTKKAVKTVTEGSTLNAQLPVTPQEQVVHSWSDYVKEDLDVQWICGVEYFKHVPFGGDKWQEFAQIGMVVEVPNYKKPSTYWPATVYGFAGYNALVEYVRVDEKKSDGPYMCWIPFCSKIPKPLGYCLKNGVPLYPTSVKDRAVLKSLDKTFQKLFAKKLPTVKPNHWELCLEELHSTATRFKINELVEALDKVNCASCRMGKITMILGNRIHVQYLGLDDDDEGFWFSQQSENVHKMGWSNAVGTTVEGARSALAYPLPPPSEFLPVPAGIKIVKDAMFQMRHPVCLHKICLAWVVKPLRQGYFLAATDWTQEDAVEIVMHVTSDYVLPINFCQKHYIALEFPKKNKKEIANFSWKKYLAEVDCPPLNLSAIKKEDTKFTRGCKLEAVDLNAPTHLGPATITKVCGHLLQIHFDGFPREDEESYQWVSATSPDIYPACYSQFIGHKLGAQPEPPNPSDLYTYS